MIRLYTDNNYNYNTSSDYANRVFNGVYFHGMAEDVLGHDIVCIPNINPIKESGIYDFEVIDSTHNHQILTGTLYIWNVQYGFKGLAIMDGDNIGNDYAKKCCANEVFHL